MNIDKAFNEDKRFLGLHRRRENFRKMCQHAIDFADTHGECQIVETGSAWHTGNWMGQGQSTIVWDWVAEIEPRVKVLSIDIRPESTKNAKAQTKNVEYMTADSVQTLNELPEEKLKKCGLLYLDSYDWSPELNIESAFHHAAELAACWRCLPNGCLIVVDDRSGPSKGKHWMVEAFMSHYLKLDAVFKNHQIGWIKTKPGLVA